MLERFIGYIPPYSLLICTILSSLIPWSVYTINTKLHKYGDPPWKVTEQSIDEDEKSLKEGAKVVSAVIIILVPLFYFTFYAGKG